MAEAIVLKNVLTKCSTVQDILDLLEKHGLPTTARIDYQNCGSHDVAIWTNDGDGTQWYDLEDKHDDVKVVDARASSR